MHWYQYLFLFLGGFVLANSLPHLANGVSGRSFQTPFANPSGKGLSSPTVNVLWGIFNLSLAYLLIIDFSPFSFHNPRHALIVGTGLLASSLFSAHHFGQFHSGR